MGVGIVRQTGVAQSGLFAPLCEGFFVASTLPGEPIERAMQTIVRGFHQANLAVVPIAGTGQMGPEEAAFAVQELVQPSAVIPWHTHEVSTTDGRVNPNTRLARFIELVDKIPVHVPLSGVTMEFNGHANCVAGCGSDGKLVGTKRFR